MTLRQLSACIEAAGARQLRAAALESVNLRIAMNADKDGFAAHLKVLNPDG